MYSLYGTMHFIWVHMHLLRASHTAFLHVRAYEWSEGFQITQKPTKEYLQMHTLALLYVCQKLIGAIDVSHLGTHVFAKSESYGSSRHNFDQLLT